MNGAKSSDDLKAANGQRNEQVRALGIEPTTHTSSSGRWAGVTYQIKGYSTLKIAGKVRLGNA